MLIEVCSELSRSGVMIAVAALLVAGLVNTLACPAGNYNTICSEIHLKTRPTNLEFYTSSFYAKLQVLCAVWEMNIYSIV